ncbi:MAG: radical SAM protein, partial [Lapillicoccus sp.]
DWAHGEAEEALHQRLEPGTSSPRARLDLVRAVTDAGLPCHVMLAPVIPHLSDDDESLDALLARIAAAGATSATVLALHLRPGAREWWFAWLGRERPELVPAYRKLYAGGTYAMQAYRNDLASRAGPLLDRHGLGSRTAAGHRHVDDVPAKVPVPTLF